MELMLPNLQDQAAIQVVFSQNSGRQDSGSASASLVLFSVVPEGKRTTKGCFREFGFWFCMVLVCFVAAPK